MNRSELIEKANTLFPGETNAGLRKEIKQSFAVPQVGEYHNEGPFMASHLELILSTLSEVLKGVFHGLIPATVRAMLTRACGTIIYNEMMRYVFLHDLDKMNCLTVGYGNGDQKAVTWPEWQDMLAADTDGWLALNGDGDALFRFCKKAGIDQISYYQQTGDGDKRQHGKVAAERLRSIPGVTEAMARAIETHEVAYQFSRISIDTYLKYFGEMSESDRDFALLASYVDTMASFRPNGEPDMRNFWFLAQSRLAAEAFVELEKRLSTRTDLTKHLLTQELDKIRKSPVAFVSETGDEAYERIAKATKVASYDAAKARTALASFSELSEADVEAIIANPGDIGKIAGKKLGKRMGEVKVALKQAEI